jgi:hypothetical protein
MIICSNEYGRHGLRQRRSGSRRSVARLGEGASRTLKQGDCAIPVHGLIAFASQARTRPGEDQHEHDTPRGQSVIDDRVHLDGGRARV